MSDPMDDAPKRENYVDVREFIRDWEAYWDQTEPTASGILVRAARIANEAGIGVMMQLDRIQLGQGSRDADALQRVPIDIEFLIASLWKMRLAGKLAESVIGRAWPALHEFDAALPDLKLMRDVVQHIDEYGQDGVRRRHVSPGTGQRIGRRWLHTMSLGEQTFGWLGGTLSYERARTASLELLSAIRTARDGFST